MYDIDDSKTFYLASLYISCMEYLFSFCQKRQVNEQEDYDAITAKEAEDGVVYV
jgi:hypothetical protein